MDLIGKYRTYTVLPQRLSSRQGYVVTYLYDHELILMSNHALDDSKVGKYVFPGIKENPFGGI